MSFHRRLRYLMQLRDVSAAELARRLEISHSNVSDWFRKESWPAGNVLARIPEPDVLDCSADWLLLGRGVPDYAESAGFAEGVEHERNRIRTFLNGAGEVRTQL